MDHGKTVDESLVELATSLESMNRKLGKVFATLPPISDRDNPDDELKALVCDMGGVIDKVVKVLPHLFLLIQRE